MQYALQIQVNGNVELTNAGPQRPKLAIRPVRIKQAYNYWENFKVLFFLIVYWIINYN